jgi:hypothetical protein
VCMLGGWMANWLCGAARGLLTAHSSANPELIRQVCLGQVWASHQLFRWDFMKQAPRPHTFISPSARYTKT